MKSGMIIQHDYSKRLYLKPKNKYVASLFGEVNEIKADYLTPVDDQDKTVLLYANELFLTDESLIKATVKKCYFKGSNYLIKAAFDRKALFFENAFEISEK